MTLLKDKPSQFIVALAALITGKVGNIARHLCFAEGRDVDHMNFL